MTEINSRKWAKLTRKRLGLTQGKLADILSVSQKHISEFERGDRFFDKPKMLQISRYFKYELIKTSDIHKEFNDLIESLKDYELTKTQGSKEIFGSFSSISYLQNNKKMLLDHHIDKVKAYLESQNTKKKTKGTWGGARIAGEGKTIGRPTQITKRKVSAFSLDQNTVNLLDAKSKEENQSMSEIANKAIEDYCTSSVGYDFEYFINLINDSKAISKEGIIKDLLFAKFKQEHA